MTDEQQKFMEGYNAVISDCAILCFCTRDTELQNAACRRLEHLRSLVEVEKTKAIEGKDEDFANALLGCSCLASAMIAELKMWVLLKEQDPDAAWTQLVNAQHNLADAMKASAGFSHLESNLERMNSIEKTVFPPQIFFSAGLVVKEEICSICGSEYEDCTHIKGQPYMGQLCTVRLIPLEVDHIAVVDEPASKHCRAYTRGAEGGFRNLMTWLVGPTQDGTRCKPGELVLQGAVATTSTFEDSKI
jgi:hypothetical protein